MWLCDNEVVWQCGCVTMWLCDNVVVWQCGCVTMWLCDNVVLWQWGCVTMWLCDNVVVWQCDDVTMQGILKGEVSLYYWPPVWLVWNQLYGNSQFLFLFAKQTNPNQSNRRSPVQWYSVQWYSLDRTIDSCS